MATPIEFDDYASPRFHAGHAAIDQYQWYSLVLDDQVQTTNERSGEPAFWDVITGLFPVSAELVAYGDGIGGDFVRSYYYLNNDDVFLVGGFQLWGLPSPNGPYYQYIKFYNLGRDFWGGYPPPYEPEPGETLVMAVGEERFAGPNDQPVFDTLPMIVRLISQSFTIGPSPANHPPSSSNETHDNAIESSACLAFQSFDPAGRLPYDWGRVCKRYPKRKHREISYQMAIGTYPTESFTFREKDRPDHNDLIHGHLQDPRKLPKFLRGTAGSDRLISYGYYRANESEDHPLVSESLDWITGVIDAKKGRAYQLPINFPVIGSLVLDSATVAELTTLPGEYPLGLLLASWADNNQWTLLDDLFEAWKNLYPDFPLDPILNPFGDSLTLPVDSAVPYVKTKKISTYQPKTRILAANNNRWGYGTPTISHQPPANDHRLFQFTEPAAWFYNLQADGSIGSLTMDSIRLREVHWALQAQKYAPQEGQIPPVVNLSYLIERGLALLGFRPELDGKHSIDAEKGRVRRAIASSDTVDEQKTGGNYFGSEGMLVRQLPNNFSAKGGAIEPGGVAIVHDLPQMMLEIYQQLAHVLGVQESGAIEIKEGSTTRRYPNQLELIKDIALTASGTYQLAHQGYVAAAVAQKQTSEIIAALGLPTISKTMPIAIGGKVSTVPVWGVSPQYSIARKIDTVGYNVAIVAGQVI